MTNSTEVLLACDEILAVPAARIPEGLFKTRYLPLFVGLPTEATFEEWVKVAGSAFREVDVYDARGAKLFTVPKLLSNADDYLEDLRKVGVMQQMQLAEQKAASMPMLGELHIQRYLTDTVKNVKPDWVSIRQWNEIFQRYGYEVIPTPDTPKPTVTTPRAKPSDEFDDLFQANIRD